MITLAQHGVEIPELPVEEIHDAAMEWYDKLPAKFALGILAFIVFCYGLSMILRAWRQRS